MAYQEPLTRASRIMLPTYPALNVIYGAVWVIDPDGRLTRAPALETARGLFPIAVWGLIWLGLAVAMIVALLASPGERTKVLYMAALVMNGIVWFAWGCVVEAAVFTHDVPVTSGVLPWFVTVACWASTVSLLWNERDSGV